ncbi:MAG: hypothetical protein NVSMB57_14790 [Actinomycetota bacterium]
MQLESEIEAIYAIGAEPIGLSVDSPGRNAALIHRWHLSFAVESDPNGARFLGPLGLMDENDPRQIGVPATVVVAPDGTQAWMHRSRDFADRPDYADVATALKSLGLPPLDPAPPPFEPAAEPEEHPSAFRTDAFGPYHRGIMFASVALASRMIDPADRDEAQGLSRQASGFLEGWKHVRARGA